MNPRLRTVLLAICVVAAGIVVYVGTFDNGFIWDDPIVLEQQMVAFKSVSDAFVPPLNIPQFGIFYYRPIGVISYMIDRSFSGPRPLDRPAGSINPYHVSVVLYHSAVCLFVFLFGRLLCRGLPGAEWAAFAGAMLFAVHPIHTESVCWMAGRSDVLAALGVVPALALFLAAKQRGSIVLFLVAPLFFLLGLLAKETGIAALLALPLIDLIPAGAGAQATEPPGNAAPGAKQGGRKGKGREVPRAASRTAARAGAPGWVWRYLPFAAVLCVYWLMRRQDLSRTDSGKSASNLLFSVDLNAQRARITEWLSDLFGAMGFYIQKSFVPTHLNAFIGDVPKDAATLAWAAVGLCAAAALGAWAWKRKDMRAFALLGLFFALLAPSLLIATFAVSETPVAERYLYMPSIAACLGAGYAGLRLAEKVTALRGPNAGRFCAAALGLAGAIVFASFGLATSARNETWRDDEAFWLDTVAKAPHQGLPHLHLGLVYDKKKPDDPAERQRYQALAEEQFLTALDETKTTYDVEGRSTALNNLANVYLGRDDYSRAIETFNKSIAMRPEYHTPRYGLALVNYRMALDSQKRGEMAAAWPQMQEAERNAQAAIGLNPRYTKAFLLLGNIQSALGNDRAARSNLQRVIQLEPGSSLAAMASQSLASVEKRQSKPAPPAGS